MTPDEIRKTIGEIIAQVKTSEGDSLTMEELRKACEIAAKLSKIRVQLPPDWEFEAELDRIKRAERRSAMFRAYMEKHGRPGMGNGPN
jgi:hypothetical protein